MAKIESADLMKSGEGSMKVLSKEKSKFLAEKYGWSLARAQGFVDGETSRRRRAQPSAYVQVGIDEYCLGFRASYYERQKPVSVEHPVRVPAVRERT
jgi:hypothetical protein